MKLPMLLSLLLATGIVFGQKIVASKVPEAIQTAFSKNFAGIKEMKWEKEKGKYEANFSENGSKKSALFEADGKWLETETGIDASALPASVKEYIAQNYKGAKIKEAAKLRMANGDDNFEAEVKGMDLIFDSKGKFIRKMKD